MNWRWEFVCTSNKKRTSFTLNQNRSPTRPAPAPAPGSGPGLSLVLDAGYRDVGTGNLGGKDCPDTATPAPAPAHPAGRKVSSIHTLTHTTHQLYLQDARIQIKNQAPVHKTLLLLPPSAVVGAGKSQLSSESISAL